MSSDLQVILKEQGIAGDQASALVKAFGGPFNEAGEILATYKNIKVTNATQTADMMEAREKRLTLKKVRSVVENNRKDLKHDIVKQGRAIDSVAKFVKEAILPAEEYLEQQEKFVQIQKEKVAAELKAKRIQILSEYTDDLSVYNLEAMDDEQFNVVVKSLKEQQEAKAAAEAEAELQRIAEEKAREEEAVKVRAENEKLKAEAQKRQAELEKFAAEKKAREEKELRFKRLEAEKKAKEAEAEKKALLAPDKTKLLAFAESIKKLAQESPLVKSPEAMEILESIEDQLVKLSDTFTTRIRKEF